MYDEWNDFNFLGWYCGTPALTAPSGECDSGFYCLASSVVATSIVCPAGKYCVQGIRFLYVEEHHYAQLNFPYVISKLPGLDYEVDYGLLDISPACLHSPR